MKAPVTRIGTGPLITGSHGGSVALPDGVILYCPQCGTECMDVGQCGVSFIRIQPDKPTKDNRPTLGFQVDCRSCGCDQMRVCIDIG